MDKDDVRSHPIHLDDKPTSSSRTPSLHQQDIGYEWNDHHETLIKKWQDRSEHYSKLHNMAGKQFATFNTWLGLPTKLFLTIIATVEFSQLSNASDSAWSFYANGLIALITLSLETTQDYLAWSSRAAKHFAAANIYDKLAMNMETELCHPRTQRVNVRAFLRHTKSTLQGTKETAPDIPDRVLTQYLKELEYEQQHPQQPSLAFVRSISKQEDTATATTTHNATTTTTTTTNPPDGLVDANHQITIALPEDQDPETDLQDEFALEMQRKIQEKKEKREQYQIRRLNE